MSTRVEQKRIQWNEQNRIMVPFVFLNKNCVCVCVYTILHKKNISIYSVIFFFFL